MPTRMGSVFSLNDQTRLLAVCLVASLLAHAALLFLAPGLGEGGKPPASALVLFASLSPRQPDPISQPQHQAERASKLQYQAEPASRPAAPRPQQVPPPSLQAPPPVMTAPTPEPVPGPAPAASVPAAPTLPAPVAAAPSAPSAAPGFSPPPTHAPRIAQPPASDAATRAAPVATANTIDAGSLNKYRLALISQARKYKRYPAQAMEKGWQGKVEVRLQIDERGRLRSATVKSSSGYAVLDAQAVDMITKGKMLAPVPPALRGREFVVDVPVIFDLQAG